MKEVLEHLWGAAAWLFSSEGAVGWVRMVVGTVVTMLAELGRFCLYGLILLVVNLWFPILLIVSIRASVRKFRHRWGVLAVVGGIAGWVAAMPFYIVYMEWVSGIKYPFLLPPDPLFQLPWCSGSLPITGDVPDRPAILWIYVGWTLLDLLCRSLGLYESTSKEDS